MSSLVDCSGSIDAPPQDPQPVRKGPIVMKRRNFAMYASHDDSDSDGGDEYSEHESKLSRTSWCSCSDVWLSRFTLSTMDHCSVASLACCWVDTAHMLLCLLVMISDILRKGPSLPFLISSEQPCIKQGTACNHESKTCKFLSLFTKHFPITYSVLAGGAPLSSRQYWKLFVLLCSWFAQPALACCTNSRRLLEEHCFISFSSSWRPLNILQAPLVIGIVCMGVTREPWKDVFSGLPGRHSMLQE